MKANLFILILISLISNHAISQWTHDSLMQVSIRSVDANYTTGIDAVSDELGGIFICWMDYRSGNNYDIYAQRIDGNGIPLWSINGVSVATSPTNEIYPRIVSDGSGGAIVSWVDSYVKVQHLNTNGVKTWDPNGILIKQVDTYYDILSDNGGAFVCCQYGGYSYFQKINSSGQLDWNPSGIKFNNFGSVYPRMIKDGEGGIIASGYSFYHIFAQKINSNGIRLWGDSLGSVLFQTSSVGLAEFPNLCSDGAGGAIISFYRSRNYPLPGGSVSLFAQKVNSNGINQWVSSAVPVCDNDTTYGFYYTGYPTQMLSDGNGGVIITWSSSGSTFLDVKCQKLSSSGNFLWGIKGLQVTNVNNDETHPVLAFDGSGGCIVSWEDKGGRGLGGTNIFAQRIYSNGTFQWRQNGIPVYNNSTNQITPVIIEKSSNESIIVWQNGSSGIYCNKISTNKINLTGQIQGFYNAGTNSSIGDTMTLRIRNNTFPNTVINTFKGKSDINGFISFDSPYLDNNIPYYLEVRHRNTIETWSKVPVPFIPSQGLVYDFSSSQAQAFSNNLIQVDNSPNVFAFYNGDVDQNGSVDLSDITTIYNDATNFVFGYVSSDVTGNNITDLSDLTLTYNNSINFVSAKKP